VEFWLDRLPICKMGLLRKRISRRVRREALRVTGEPAGRLISIGPNNASAIANQYCGVRAETLIEEGGITSLVPLHLPMDCINSLRPFRIACETVLLAIENEGFSLRNELLHDPERNVLFAETLSESEVLGLRRYAPRHCRKIRGTVAYLSNTWVENYYHWMQLTLPLLRLYGKLAGDIRPDYYYLGENGGSRRIQEETLSLLDICPEQILREPCRADRLLVAIYLHRPQHLGARFRDIWGHAFVRRLYALAERQGVPSRIYVKRGQVKNRRIRNEDEVTSALTTYGFRPVLLDGLTVREQARLFSEAEAIVGMHGAALTNLLFARSNAAVVEIFPRGVIEASHFTASTYSNLRYHYMIAESVPKGPEDDVLVNIEKLEAVLKLADITPE
jgi:hypothetical protein